MNQKIRRRQFGRLLLVSTAATTALGHFTSGASAQTSQIIYGADFVSGVPILKSMDVGSGVVQDLSALASALRLNVGERLTGFSAVSATSFQFSSTYNTGTSNVNRLYSLGTSLKILTVSGLGTKDTVESMLVNKDGTLLGLVSRNHGVPPFSIAKFDKKTGKATILVDFPLPTDWRFNNLTQHPDGTYVGTSIQRDGSTRLVRVNRQKRQLIRMKLLRADSGTLMNDLRGMAFTSSGQLHVLGDPTYQGTNSIFTVDTSTGTMSPLRVFAVGKIAFIR